MEDPYEAKQSPVLSEGVNQSIEGNSLSDSGVQSSVKRQKTVRKAPADRFKYLTDELPHMVFIADSEGKTIYYNKRFYEYAGIKKEDDDGWSWVRVLHPEDLLLANIEGARAAEENRSFQLEVRCLSGEGTYRWHLLHAAPLFDEESGETQWFGTATDIHVLKQMQQALAEDESRLRTLADAIPHIIFTTGARGEIEFCNHRWYEYLGLTHEQTFAGGWKLLIHPDDLPGYLSCWSEALKSGDSIEIEFRLKRAVGRGPQSEYRLHLARAVCMRLTDGNIGKWFATWTDLEHTSRTRE